MGTSFNIAVTVTNTGSAYITYINNHRSVLTRYCDEGYSWRVRIYLHPDLGPNFIRALAKQEPLALKDYNQEMDGIAKGKFLVLIGVSDIFAQGRMEAGMPIATLDPRKIKEGSDIGCVDGALTMFNRAPHPNAAKVYINWLLSKEGRTAYALLNGNISTRLDVPTDQSPWRVPIPGSIKTYTRAAQDVKDDLRALLREAMSMR